MTFCVSSSFLHIASISVLFFFIDMNQLAQLVTLAIGKPCYSKVCLSGISMLSALLR